MCTWVVVRTSYHFYRALNTEGLTEWRKPPHPVYTADYATYVHIITWFLDDPSSLCPFSVHRMALVGKQLGVKVGQWFGPSTAAGAIKCVQDCIAKNPN
jgi:hypothetical protein